MKKLIGLAGLIGVMLLGTGCVSVMKKEAFEGPMVHTGDQVNKIRADLAAKTTLYEGISAKTSAPQAAPYPELGTLLPQMKTAFAAVSKNRERMFVMEKEFTDLRQGRPDISSDRPQWEPFMKLYEEMKVMVPTVNTQIEAYSSLSNRFAELCNQHGIREIKVKEIKGKLSGHLAALDKSVLDTKAQAVAMKEKLRARTNATMGIDQQSKRNAIIDRIRLLADQVEAAAAGLKGKVKAFDESLEGKGDFYQGPGFPKIAIVDEMAKGMEGVNALIGQIQGEVGKWNAMN